MIASTLRNSAAVMVCATALAFAAGLTPVDAHAQQERYSSTSDYFPTWYLGLRGSVNLMRGDDLGTYPLPDKDWNPGFAVGGAVGLKLPSALIQPLSGLSIEGEFMRYWQNIDNDRTDFAFPWMIASEGERDYDITALMVNAYYHFPLNSIFKPYIGGGLGVAQVELEHDPAAPVRGDNKDNVGAWQLMLGLSFEESPKSLTEWNVGYRYLSLGDAEFDDGSGTGTKTIIDTDVHSLEAGVKFRF